MVLHIGCCGFGRARAEYYRWLGLVEVQQTFYKPPQLATVRRWREEAPASFQFTVKAWQLITHEPSSPTYRKASVSLDGLPAHYGAFRPTPEVAAAWDCTREIALALRAPVVLFQCPASFGPTAEHLANLRSFFREVDRGGLVFTWEPRGDWPDDLVRLLCDELGLIHAVDPFSKLPVTGGIAYFRLHGITGYRYRFTDGDLKRLLSWCRGYDEVYCLFNNVSMWDDAGRFLELAEDD